MIVLGLNAAGHDTGAAILQDNGGRLQMVAITEERLNRSKHSRQYPLLSIDYCLKAFGLNSLRDVDLIAVANNNLQMLQEDLHPNAPRRPGADHSPVFNYAAHWTLDVDHSRIVVVHHLLAHAASAFYLSPFEDAGVLTVDAGLGIFSGRDRDLTVFDVMGYGPTVENGQVSERKLTYGTGVLFNVITAQLGFGHYGHGKTMALAAYGHLFDREDLLPEPEDRHKSVFIEYRSMLEHAVRTIPTFDPEREFKGVEGVLAPQWVNLARQAQELLEQDMLFLAADTLRKARSRNLCLAGGVALSCVTNRRIYDSGLCDGLFIQPASSDAGVALGCALAGYYMHGGTVRDVMHHAYLGRPNNPYALEDCLRRSGLPYRKCDNRQVAQLLADGKIVGRVAGGSEYGPRALGNRSILADPRRPYMAEVLNRRVKHRELFRPFAPSCHADKAHLYFDMPIEGPFMILAAPVKPQAKGIVPAAVHVDGSCRPQTVRPDQNRGYYDLIEEFGKKTGVYCLLNTSFNDNREPIVETYQDALSTFLSTGLDHLCMDGYLVDRPGSADVGSLPHSSRPCPDDQHLRYQELAEKLCNYDNFRRMRRELADRQERAA